MVSLKRYLISTYEKFCARTHMHGFSELATSKSLQGKIFWCTVILICLAITTYQITKAVQHYINQPYITVIEKIADEELMYPNFRLCYHHWIYWVDFEKASVLKFSKKATMYGLSYLTDIYTHTSFDVDEAKGEFFETMKFNNLTTLLDFYRAIAKPSPNPLFKDIYLYSGFVFCYVANLNDQVIKQTNEEGVGLKLSTGISVVMEINVTVSNIEERFITMDEQDCYVARFFFQRRNVDVMDYFKTTFNSNSDGRNQLPPYFEIDEDVVEIHSDDYIFHIRAQGKVSKWQNKPKAYCRKNAVAFHSDDYWTCQDTCEQNFRNKSCVCLWFHEVAAKGVHDRPDKICRHEIHFLSSTNACVPLIDDTSVRRSVSTNSLNCTLDKYSCCVNAFNNETVEINECLKKCTFACTSWRYTVGNIQKMRQNTFRGVKLKLPLAVSIFLPNSQDVLATIEIDNQSLEKFIGNIGGLLGIWTGASILSMFQIFYLCCCGEFRWCSKCNTKKKHHHNVVYGDTANNVGDTEYVF